MQSVSLGEALGYVSKGSKGRKEGEGKEGLAPKDQMKVLIESTPLLNDYNLEDINVDEGKYRTVITISLLPKTMLKLKGKEVKKGLLSLS